MADFTKIEWTEATWNIITGCSVISPGCAGCYAMKLAGSRLQHHPSRAGLTMTSKAGPVWNGQVRFNEEWLTQPLQWKRPRMIFVCAHGDLFHESAPDAWIDRVFAVMALAPQHTFQVLTKRSARMREYFDSPTRGSNIAAHILKDGDKWGTTGTQQLAPLGNRAREEDPSFVVLPLPNVWLGVSVEDQKRADERIPDLLATPAAVRWISAEPLLGPVRMDRIEEDCDDFSDCGGHPDPAWPTDTHDWMWLNALTGEWNAEARSPEGERLGNVDVGLRHTGGKLDWVVVGGESGSGARPMHPDWARSLRDQCAAAGVPFFFKQWGAWAAILDRDNDDPDWRGNYSDLRERNQAIINLAGGMGFHGARVHVVEKVGKARAGRLLDGIEHNGMPGVP